MDLSSGDLDVRNGWSRFEAWVKCIFRGMCEADLEVDDVEMGEW